MTEATPSQIPTDTELTATVIQLLASTLGKKAGKIKADSPIFSSHGVFDSYGVMEFVLRLEDAFGFSIPDEDLDPEIFYSVRNIVGYLRKRLSEKA